MSKSKAARSRRKAIREGRMDPSDMRGVFHRKPQTQVVPNGKAKQRQSFCRKKDDGAVFLFVA
jgi:hypothetical protein